VEQARVGSMEALWPAEAPSPAMLASRVDRFLATVVDIVVGSVLAIPLGMLTGQFSAIFRGGVTQSAYVENILVGWGWFLLVDSYFLERYGQTVGKRLLGIRMSDSDTEAVPPFWRLLVRTAVAPCGRVSRHVGRTVYACRCAVYFR
jgi:uncharacterized RDD family membrane protein YckC